MFSAADSERHIVLAIDDSPLNLEIIEAAIGDEYMVYKETSGEKGMKFLEKTIPDLILLDVMMPGMDGYQFIAELKKQPVYDEIPVIFLTASEGNDDEARAFRLGAVDYIKKPIVTDVVKARVRLHLELQIYRKQLENLVFERTKKLERTEDCILSLLANVAAYRDEETGAHIRRTTCYVEVLVNELQRTNIESYHIDKEYGMHIVKSAKLHDIGKVAVPDGILLKPGKLTPEEFETIKLHTIDGAHMIDDAIRDLQDDSFLRVAREIVIAHHEKWNGKGYPYGLKGEEIPLSARIMAISDVYDALISRRPYKEPFTHEKALDIIYKDSGTHFDPVILEVAKDAINEFNDISQKYGDLNYVK